MRLEQKEPDPQWYLYLTENCFIHARNDWSQVFGTWNWYEFNIVHIYLENDKMTGGIEFEFIILGLGFRLRYNYNWEGSEAGKRLEAFKQEQEASEDKSKEGV